MCRNTRRQKPGIQIIAWTCLLGSPLAHGESWSPDPRCVGMPSPVVLAGVRGTYELGTVPPFRVAERNRLSIGPEACVRLHDQVQLTAAWDWLSDTNGAGETVSGPGDIRLGTAVQLFQLHGGHLDLGWMAKLPDARDEEELGTDETDVTIGISGGFRSGPWDISGGVALGIWGNPLRFANQDDVVLLRGEGWWSHEWVALGTSVQASPESDRNPTRILLTGFARVGRSWFGQISGGGGLSPASPDGLLALEFGYRTPTSKPSTSR